MSFLGAKTRRCTDGGEIWQGGGALLHAKFHPHRCSVSPLRGEKPQNRPPSKLNTGRLALRAMLPVIKITFTMLELSHLPVADVNDIILPYDSRPLISTTAVMLRGHADAYIMTGRGRRPINVRVVSQAIVDLYAAASWRG